jgi:hypothetical protein
MAKPKAVLSPKDYENYRNVRAVAVMFVVSGVFLVPAGVVLNETQWKTDPRGIGIATQRKPDPQRALDPVAIGMSIVGLAGVVGGIAALRGNRRWAKLASVMAVPYLLALPVGTLMSSVMLSGLSRYLDSKERVRKATIGWVKSDFADL